MLTVSNLKKLDGTGTRVSGNSEDDVTSVRSSATAVSNRSRRRSSWYILKNNMHLATRRLTRSTPWRQQAEPEPTRVKFENTYKMEPDGEILFRHMSVEREVKPILEKHLAHETVYSPNDSGRLTAMLTDVIKDRVKELGFKRHKIVVQVVLGSQGDQSMQMVSRCLWNSDTDNFVSVSYENKAIFAIVGIFAVYFE